VTGEPAQYAARPVQRIAFFLELCGRLAGARVVCTQFATRGAGRPSSSASCLVIVGHFSQVFFAARDRPSSPEPEPHIVCYSSHALAD
jgi:hypothetical protein